MTNENASSNTNPAIIRAQKAKIGALARDHFGFGEGIAVSAYSWGTLALDIPGSASSQEQATDTPQSRLETAPSSADSAKSDCAKAVVCVEDNDLDNAFGLIATVLLKSNAETLELIAAPHQFKYLAALQKNLSLSINCWTLSGRELQRFDLASRHESFPQQTTVAIDAAIAAVLQVPGVEVDEVAANKRQETPVFPQSTGSSQHGDNSLIAAVDFSPTGFSESSETVAIASYKGLEVARVSSDGFRQVVHFGVGAYDQGALQAINPNLDGQEALRFVLQQVAPLREKQAELHPLNRVCRSAWLRYEYAQQIQAPKQIQDLLALNEPDGINHETACFALVTSPAAKLASQLDASDTNTNTEATLVCFNVGPNPQGLLEAAALASAHQASRIELVMPKRDHYGFYDKLIARCKIPVTLSAPEIPWPQPGL